MWSIFVPRPKSSLVQIALRIPREWVDLADRLATLLSKPGAEVTRSDMLRRAIIVGLEVLQGQHGGNDEQQGK